MVKNDVLKHGSSVVEVAYLDDYELDWAKDYNTSFHRSRGTKIGDHPFGSYMINKKWTLEEEMNNHILRFQQVKCSLISLIH